MSKETKQEKALTKGIKNDALDKHFAGCEAKDICCLCIPIRPGVIILAILGVCQGV